MGYFLDKVHCKKYSNNPYLSWFVQVEVELQKIPLVSLVSFDSELLFEAEAWGVREH